MLKPILVPLVLPLLLLFGNGSDKSVVRKQINNGLNNSIARVKQPSKASGNSEARKQESPQRQTGTLEKMIVADGTVAVEIDLNRLNGSNAPSQMTSLSFTVAPNSFFRILVFNKDLRGPEPGSMAIIPQNSAILPAPLDASFNQLVIEKARWTEPFDIVVRDGKTGFTFFNIEGNLYDYDAKSQLLSITDGRLLISEEFASRLGRPSDAGSVIGGISITATMRPIEITQVVNGETRSSEMPPLGASVPGPDVIVGDLSNLSQFGGSVGTQVGLAVGTDSCNAGQEPLNWFALPNNDHPVIPMNLYRMSGGTTNDERFEQVGQSWLKHAFTALQDDICGFGCQPHPNGTRLGVGCSDPYSAGLNAQQNGLGSRAFVNPFTGFYPGGVGAGGPRDHTGHAHPATTHRILVEIDDLNTTLNPGAAYFAEAQYVTPHEYAWCQANPGQCNQYNNASYRRFNVSGTTSFSFTPVGSTERTKPAVQAWPGATTNPVEPAPGVDGIASVSYKVTNPSPGVWHYEYAVYNQNLDRAIQSFSVPLPPGVIITNVGFHAPPQHPGIANDGTVGSAGYSSTPWTPVQTSDSITWSSETFAQNQNANAIRWGTMYNFRFDANQPPQNTNATVGFFKTGSPINVAIQSPSQGGGAQFTVTASPSTVNPGQTINVSWTAPAGRPANDWIGLYRVGDPDTAFLTYVYTGGAQSGNANFTAPAQGGQYDFRYFTNDTFNKVATSNAVTVTGGGGSFTLAASPTTVSPGQTINVSWTAPAGRPANDWIGLYRVGDPDTAYLAYVYTGGAQSGNANFTAPGQSGQYDFRYFTNDTFNKVATSNAVTVTGGGFNSVPVASGITTPTAMAFAPDGRLFVAQQTGQLRVISGGALLPTPFVSLSVNSTGERGLLGVAFDPDFANNQFVYLYYTTSTAPIHNRVSRFTANGNVAVVGSELPILDLENLSATNHNGGAIHFGPDNKLYVAVGENANPSNSQTLNNRLGKMLRINSDGTIPEDNPFFFTATGNNRAIWALGLRNPYTFAFQPGSGRMFINDVGQSAWEEINDGIAGSNYGWSICEGACGNPTFRDPVFQYENGPVGPTSGCAITGGAFYNPAVVTYPPEFVGKYFFSDFCSGWIRRLDPATNTAADFVSNLSLPVDLQVGPDGNLHYLVRGGGGAVFKITFS